MPFSTPADFAKAKADLKRLGPSAIQNYRPMLTYVRLLRELGVTDSEGVLEYGSALITKFPRRLGWEEYWQLHEEVAIAAFTCGQPEVGRQILQKLQKKFRDSNRVECLRGMAYESIGELDEAELIYDKIIATKPTFPDALKRKIGLNVTRGNLPEAIFAASTYLEVFQTDAQVWDQLHRLYVQAGSYSQAQFCLEEALLHNPGNAATMLKLADLHYAQGGAENFTTAHSYYARVLHLTNGENVRAMYGVLAVKQALEASGKGDVASSELCSLSRDRLLQLYEAADPSKAKIVQAVV